MVTKDKEFLTGMEYEVAKLQADDVKGIKISESDRQESLIEIADNLFRFLYFKGKNSIENAVDFDHENITPYNIDSFGEITDLANQRNLLVNMWGKYKYREWKYEEINKDDINYGVFSPSLINDYKKENIGINRYMYRDHILHY
ncbi:hypothetical protein JFL43_10730 [Viridibacillus sp. YIM B01967]|uniref:Uncharacterized protein n=1 Tax=Viridibacillus soli TaxID=2798301 RepID=A0ABS1H7C9_9BACL|nr:hypothetical protein [Viridibacillus soli]MBK3495317.1 hypothetical protein [Viridibacillus soli]